MNMMIEVRTKEQLEQAVKNQAQRIVVKGELAEKLQRATVIKKLSRPALVVMGAALAAAPFTGGTSAAAGAVGFSAGAGVGIASMTAVVFLGIALIMSINKGYDVKFTAKSDAFGEATMDLNKRKD